MRETVVWLFLTTTLVSIAVIARLRSEYLANPDFRSRYLYRLNCGLLIGAIAMVLLRYAEELGVAFNFWDRSAFVYIQSVLAPIYGVLVIAHIWANRDYYRPRNMGK